MTDPEYKKAFDADGNEIEVLSKTDAEKIIGEKETLIKEGAEKLAKFETKDFNFGALKTATKEERETLLGKLSDAERAVVEQQERHETELADLRSERVADFRNDAISTLVGDDKEMVKKIIANYDRIVGEAKTKEEIQARVREAYNMLGVPSVSNPIAGAAGSTGLGDLKVKREPSELTPDLKEFGKKFGLSDETLNKHGKPKEGK